MSKTTAVYVTLALLIGLGGGYAVAAREPAVGAHVMPSGEQMNDTDMSMGSAMADMTAALEGKSGDEFDKAFLAEMIVHHQGAVDMARAVLERGKHEELKQLAREIIAAQTKEIGQMQIWAADWYGKK